MNMTRRTFFGWLAKGAVAAVALKVIPATALPLQGELHDAIRESCLAQVRKAIMDFHAVNKGRNYLARIDANPAFWDQMSTELRANQRIMFGGMDSSMWENLVIKNTMVIRNDRIKDFTFRLVDYRDIDVNEPVTFNGHPVDWDHWL